MTEDERRDQVRKRHRADDSCANLRVDADLLEFFRRQRSRLGEDVLGHGKLADVVQERCRLHAADIALRHAERAREANGVQLNSTDVVVGGLVLCVDGERQRLDGREVQLRDLIGSPGNTKCEVERKKGDWQQPER